MLMYKELDAFQICKLCHSPSAELPSAPDFGLIPILGRLKSNRVCRADSEGAQEGAPDPSPAVQTGRWPAHRCVR